MPADSYTERRAQLTRYFDQTASQAWERLTSTAPVGRIRATVRAGRDAMRSQLLDWLPANLTAVSLLDAGCGTGSLAVDAARRGARVTAVDVSPTLLEVARRRTPAELVEHIDYRAGDMLDVSGAPFDQVVAMDSLIHYRDADILAALEALCGMARCRVAFTFAPRTVALSLMHASGRLLPRREDRSPAIEPVSEKRLRRLIAGSQALTSWRIERSHRVNSGFYISQALELVRQ